MPLLFWRLLLQPHYLTEVCKGGFLCPQGSAASIQKFTFSQTSQLEACGWLWQPLTTLCVSVVLLVICYLLSSDVIWLFFFFYFSIKGLNFMF